MFIDFFLLLRRDGLPVTVREYLDLLKALDKSVISYNVDDFYYLSRSALVKHEQFLDRFDKLFGVFFKGVQTIDSAEFLKIPEQWLQRGFERVLREEDKEFIKSLGGLDKLMERLRELLREQKKRHEGGNKWIGTGGTSPFGAYGYNPEGIRIGQEEGRHRRAVKVWDKRDFRNLSDGVELNTRNMKLALKRLRALTREGVPEELDIDGTIEKTSKNAGMLDIEMIPSKRNHVKVLLFLDVGGSMDDHIEICARLFSAAKYEFKRLEHFYFHNCIYERVWRDNTRRWEEVTPTFDVIHKYNGDYKVIIVADAAMSPYELLYQNGSVEHNNDEAGFTWLERIKNQYPDIVWLNPLPEEDWRYVETAEMIRKFMNGRMYPLTLSGIARAIKTLKKRNLKQDAA
ncbi:MAG: vWA domain-containing protein [Deltaproteobacteria bacterium]